MRNMIGNKWEGGGGVGGEMGTKKTEKQRNGKINTRRKKIEKRGENKRGKRQNGEDTNKKILWTISMSRSHPQRNAWVKLMFLLYLRGSQKREEKAELPHSRFSL